METHGRLWWWWESVQGRGWLILTSPAGWQWYQWWGCGRERWGMLCGLTNPLSEHQTMQTERECMVTRAHTKTNSLRCEAGSPWRPPIGLAGDQSQGWNPHRLKTNWNTQRGNMFTDLTVICSTQLDGSGVSRAWSEWWERINFYLSENIKSEAGEWSGEQHVCTTV